MKPEFHEVYESLYREFLHVRLYQWGRFPYEGLEPELISELIYETQRAIDNTAETKRDYPVRPDARYFLLVNFYEMVLRPIALVRRRNKGTEVKLELPEMRADLKHDIELILNNAEGLARKKDAAPRNINEQTDDGDERQISGHDVIDAIGSVWNELNFSKYLYWGRI